MILDIKPELNLSPNELAEKYSYLVDESKFTFMQQYNLIVNLGTRFNINFTNEQIIFILTSKYNLLCDACPGAGKTTTAKFSILHKHYVFNMHMFRILYIVYNRQAKEEFSNSFEDLQATLNNMKNTSLHINDKPNISTMHSLAKEWVTEYCYELGYTRDQIKGAIIENVDEIFNNILSDNHAELFELATNYDVRSLIQYYNYSKECDLDLYTIPEEELKANRYYPKMIPLEVVQNVFDKYDEYKLVNIKVDFTDLLTKFYKLLSTNEAVLTRLKANYEYIIVDEFQDATALFLNIFKLLSTNDNIKVMGDIDQCLYNFRGAESQNMLEFKNIFPNGLTTTLSVNMRCPNRIVSLANTIISNNTMRYDKMMTGTFDEHELVILPILSKASFMHTLITKIKSVPTTEQGDIGILYRNSRTSSYIVTYLALKENIPFKVNSGMRLFGDMLSKSLLTLFNYASMPNKDFLKQLYRYTPLNKVEALEVYKTCDTLEDFLPQCPFNSLRNSIEDLIEFRELARQYYSSNCCSKVLANIYLYYINFINQSMAKKGENVDNELYSLITEFFVSDTFSVYQILTKIAELTSTQESRFAIKLSTIHSAKGTEYKYVILPDVDRNFPNMYSIQDSSEANIRQYLEEEIRALYVGVTRTKYSLTVFTSNSVFTELFEEHDTLLSEPLAIEDLNFFDDLETADEQLLKGYNEVN